MATSYDRQDWVTIWRAQGAIAERHQLTLDDALKWLCAEARGVTVNALALQIVRSLDSRS